MKVCWRNISVVCIVLLVFMLIPTTVLSRTVALIVSCETYSPPYKEEANLVGTAEDTQSIREVLIDIFGVAPLDIRQFHDTIQNGDQMENQIRSLFDISEADVYVIYYSGHGARRGKSNSELVLPWGSFTDDDLKDLVSEAPGQVVVIIDACQAGGFSRNVSNKKNVAVMTASAINRTTSMTTNGSFYTLSLSDAFTWHANLRQNYVSHFVDWLGLGIDVRTADKNNDGIVSLIDSHNYVRRNYRRWMRSLLITYSNPQFGGQDRQIALDHEWEPDENLDFRRGTFAGWNFQGDARIIAKNEVPSSLRPKRGQHMAVITTGTGSIDNRWSEISAFVPIGNPNKNVELRWNFLSNEYPEWVGTEFNDRFEVWIAAQDGQWQQVLTSDSVNEANWKNTNWGFNGETGWRDTKFVPANYGITGNNMWLRFCVTDVGDSSVDSAALIDFIRLP